MSDDKNWYFKLKHRIPTQIKPKMKRCCMRAKSGFNCDLLGNIEYNGKWYCSMYHTPPQLIKEEQE